MFKPLFSSFLALVLLLVSAPLPSQARQNAVDVFGFYRLADKAPVEFADLDHLHLSTIDERGRPAPLNGFLRPKQRRRADFTLTNLKLEGKALSFTTKAVAGVSYGFTGEFSELGEFSANPPAGKIILTGQLLKLKNGTKVAELKARFRYETGG